jgi:hypothetical protein
VARKFGDAIFGQALALALVLEGLGHHGHGQDAQLAGHLGHHRAGTGTGAAAHAGGDEHHVRTLQRLGDALALGDRQFARFLRLAAGAQARAKLQLDMGIALFQSLRVGVAADEFDATDAFADHVIHRVAARTADPHDLDHGRVAVTFR